MKKRNIHSITSVVLVMLMLIGTLSSFTALDYESAKPLAADDVATSGIKKTLKDVYDLVMEKTDWTQYVPSTTEALRTALEKAENVLADDEATKQMVMDVIQELADAGQLLVFTVQQEVITRVEEIPDRDLTIYTADSVKALERALGNIEQLQSDRENGLAVSQARWDSALEELELALAGLTPKSEVEILLDELDALYKTAILIDVTQYTQASGDALYPALTEAIRVLGLTANRLTVEVLQQAIDGLDAAIKGMISLEDYEEQAPALIARLEELIAQAEKEDLTSYTDDSVLALTNALATAQNLLKQNQPGLDDLQNAITGLEEALENLVLQEETPQPEVDKSLLEALLGEAKERNLSDYTQESVRDLQLAMKAAALVLHDDQATQETVDQALEDLQAALDNLDPKEETSSEPESSDSNVSSQDNSEVSTSAGVTSSSNPNASAISSTSTPTTGDNSFSQIALLAVTLVGVLGASAVFIKKKSANSK